MKSTEDWNMQALASWRILAALIIGSVVAFAAPQRAEALHTKLPLITQVTKGPNSITGDPSYIVGSNLITFHTDNDILGTGSVTAGTPQVFVYFPILSLAKKPKQASFQVTDEAQGAVNPAAARQARTLAYNTMNGGRQIFFSRRAKIKKNIFEPLPLTHGPGGESYDSILSGTGRYILFTSTSDLGFGLPPGPHIYRSDLRLVERAKCPYPCPLGNSGLRLLTTQDAANPNMDMTGNQVVFESRGNAGVPNGCANGFSQIFLKNFATNVTEQLTFGAADSHSPHLSQDGKKVFFTSAADLADHSLGYPVNTRQNIFVLDLKITPRPRPVPLTFGTDGDVSDLVPSGPTGTRVFFRSTANHTGAAAGPDRLYFWQKLGLTSEIVRVTDGTPSLLSPLTADFAFVTITSAYDFLSNGTTTPQIFYINSFRLQPDPVLPTPTFTPPPTRTPTPTPTRTATPTPTPFPGQPARIGLALLAAESIDNGDNTLSTVVAATVGDYLGNPVADGTFVNFSIYSPIDGLVVSNGRTNTEPDCNVEPDVCSCLNDFVAETGIPIINRPGVVHVCLTYVYALTGTEHTISAQAGVGAGYGQFTLPLPRNDCTTLGQPCNDFNGCTDGDVCVTDTTPSECKGGRNAHGDCTDDIDCPDLMICSGGARDGNQCTDASECPDLRKCLNGDNNNAVCTTEFDCPGGSCALFSSGLCVLENEGSCVVKTPPLVCQSGTPVTCADDANPCTVDECDFFTGECGTPVACPFDNNTCTDDVCNVATGTCGVPNSDPCAADDNVCTDDVCDGTSGTCIHVPNSAPCEDTNPCTDDICDGATGTCGIPNTAPCDDGDFCTLDDTCAGGTCQSGAPVVCPDDGNPCTSDVCNPNNGTCGIPGVCVCP